MEPPKMPNGSLVEEFAWKNVFFSNSDDSLLTSFQWRLERPNYLYVVYRWCVLVAILSFTVYSFVVEEQVVHARAPGVWMVYATNWSVIILFICVLLMAVNSTWSCATKRYLDSSYRNPTLLSQIEWFFYSSSYPIALTVTITFWSFVFMYVDSSTEVILYSTLSRIKHSVFSAYILVDVWLSAVPLKIVHFVHPLGISLLYIFFNAVYFYNKGDSPTGQPYAYHVIDWRYPIVAVVFCFADIFLLLTMHTILFAIYRLKLMIFWKTIGNPDEEKRHLINARDVPMDLQETDQKQPKSGSYSATDFHTDSGLSKSDDTTDSFTSADKSESANSGSKTHEGNTNLQ